MNAYQPAHEFWIESDPHVLGDRMRELFMRVHASDEGAPQADPWGSIPEVAQANITDTEDEFYTGCTEWCDEDCMADHRGEE